MFVTEKNFRPGIKVKISKKSRFLNQVAKYSYGIIVGNGSNGWCEVQWYNCKNTPVYSNHYRIKGEYDLEFFRKPLTQFELEFWKILDKVFVLLYNISMSNGHKDRMNDLLQSALLIQGKDKNELKQWEQEELETILHFSDSVESFIKEFSAPLRWDLW